MNKKNWAKIYRTVGGLLITYHGCMTVIGINLAGNYILKAQETGTKTEIVTDKNRALEQIENQKSNGIESILDQREYIKNQAPDIKEKIERTDGLYVDFNIKDFYNSKENIYDQKVDREDTRLCELALLDPIEPGTCHPQILKHILVNYQKANPQSDPSINLATAKKAEEIALKGPYTKKIVDSIENALK